MIGEERQTMVARRIALAAMSVTVLTLGATLLASTAAAWWFGDLAVHFRVQLGAAALVALFALCSLRRWLWAAGALVALVANAMAVTAVLGSAGVVPRIASASAADLRQPLRIASINVLFHNPHHDRVAAFLRAVHPDAAVLVEITPQWRDALAPLRDVLPYQYYARGTNGTLLLSRWPFERVATVKMGPHADPTVAAVLDVRGRMLHLIGVHPSWPLGPDVSAERNRELQALAALARRTPRPLVMAGDFNVTPFSPHFRAFVAQSGLDWAAQGAGWQPTWPTFLPVGGIEIDHAFVSPDIAVRRFSRGPGVGSDHRPILVDLDW